MGDCLLSNFNLAKLHFDQSNIYIRNFKIICEKFLSLLCLATVHSNLPLKGLTNRLLACVASVSNLVIRESY